MLVLWGRSHQDGQSVSKIFKQLTSSGWVLSRTTCSFPDFGVLVIGKASIIVGVHDSTQAWTEPVLFCIPPSPKPLPLAAYIWQPFNKVEYCVSLAKDDESFMAQSNHGIVAMLPSPSVLVSLPNGVWPLHYLHSQDSSTATLSGTAVLSPDSLCPAFDGSPNPNLFHCQFRVEFHNDDHTHVRAILPFEFTSCFWLTNQLRYCLSQHVIWYALDAGIPALTSAWISNHIHERLVTIWNSNTKIFPPNQYAAPAAHVQAFVSGVVATHIPDRKRWVQAITSDPELSKIRDIVANPSKLTNKASTKINYNYHATLWKSLIVVEDNVLIYHEPLAGGNGSYTHLQLVPWEFRNILFIPFHTNLIGGHLNSYCTLHCLCLWYYWPGMYLYVKRMCASCPGCALSNPTKSKSSELVYNFPIEAPFIVMHVDAYMAGAHSGF